MKKSLLLLSLLLLPLMGIHAASVLKDGENLRYTLYYNWRFVWIKAGTATLSTARTTHDGADAYRCSLVAATAKSADAIFRLRDTLTTLVTPAVEPIAFCKHCEEGKDIICEEATFGRKDGRYTAHQTKTWPDGRVKNYDFIGSFPVYDMISVLQHARTLDTSTLRPGQRLTFPMVTGKKVENQDLIYLGRETLTTDDGRNWNVQTYSILQKKKTGKTAADGTPQLEESELIRFYCTDDARHLPLQLDLFLKIGVAKAKIQF